MRTSTSVPSSRSSSSGSEPTSSTSTSGRRRNAAATTSVPWADRIATRFPFGLDIMSPLIDWRGPALRGSPLRLAERRSQERGAPGTWLRIVPVHGYEELQEGRGRGKNGVAEGTRTPDNRNHNPGLYQLSYSHHWNWPARQDSNL